MPTAYVPSDRVVMVVDKILPFTGVGSGQYPEIYYFTFTH